MLTVTTSHGCGCDYVCCCGDHVTVICDLCDHHASVPVSPSHVAPSLSLDLSPRVHASTAPLCLDLHRASSSAHHRINQQYTAKLHRKLHTVYL